MLYLSIVKKASIDGLLQPHKLLNMSNNRNEVYAAINLYKLHVNLDQGCWPPPQLDSKNEEGYKAAMEHFYSHREGPNSHETDDYVKDLERKLINDYNDLREENTRQNQTAVIAALKVFNDTMDASLRGPLKVTVEQLAELLRDALEKGKSDFLSKRATSSTCRNDDYWNLLEKGMVDRFEHYGTKNGDNFTALDLIRALMNTVAAAANRFEFTIALGIALHQLFKK